MKRLVLVRHGESGWNVEGRIQGQLGVGLSPRGHEQAAYTATWLAEAFPNALLAVSDLERTRDTMMPLAEQLGRTPLIEPGLREMDFGNWSGRRARDIEADEPDRWLRWSQGEDVVPEVGGEERGAFTRRVVDTIEQLLFEVDDGEDIVCVTHGGPIKFGVPAMLGLQAGVIGAVANCSITELVLDEGVGRRLDSWNQTAHLPVALRTSTRFIERIRPVAVSDQPARDDSGAGA